MPCSMHIQCETSFLGQFPCLFRGTPELVVSPFGQDAHALPQNLHRLAVSLGTEAIFARQAQLFPARLSARCYSGFHELSSTQPAQECFNLLAVVRRVIVSTL